MALFNFFKSPKPNHYDYKPMYWDPAKEEKARRAREIKAIKSGDTEEVKSRLAGSFKKKGYGGHPTVRKNAVFKSNMILIATIFVLLLLSYLILYLNLPGLLKFLN